MQQKDNHEYFFFQAEDGIRDYKVTGVQTCALPIYVYERARERLRLRLLNRLNSAGVRGREHHADARPRQVNDGEADEERGGGDDLEEIGRAAWREREEISEGGESLKKKT